MDNDKILHLTLKSKWYGMIESGEKKEEYREIKQFWVNRLLNVRRDFAYDFDAYSDCVSMLGSETEHAMKAMNAVYRDYDCVCFHKGYTSTTMTFKINGIGIGYGRLEWGAPKNKKIFIISLGERIL